MNYNELYQSTQKKLEEIKMDFIQERTKYETYRKDSYETLSRFVHLCEDRKWERQPGFREMRETWWNFGHN